MAKQNLQIVRIKKIKYQSRYLYPTILRQVLSLGSRKNLSYQEWSKYLKHKTEEYIKTNQDYRGREDVQKTIKIVYFDKQENNVKQDHREYIYKNFIR